MNELRKENPELADRYEALKDLVMMRRVQFFELASWLESSTEWLTAPASTKYHLNRKHGLLEHSVNVTENLLKLKETLAPDMSTESCVIVGLFHDLGKAGMPGKPQYLENEPSEKQKWAGYPATVPFKYNTDLVYLSIPLRSLYPAAPAADGRGSAGYRLSRRSICG